MSKIILATLHKRKSNQQAQQFGSNNCPVCGAEVKSIRRADTGRDMMAHIMLNNKDEGHRRAMKKITDARDEVRELQTEIKDIKSEVKRETGYVF